MTDHAPPAIALCRYWVLDPTPEHRELAEAIFTDMHRSGLNRTDAARVTVALVNLVNTAPLPGKRRRTAAAPPAAAQ